MRLSLFSDRRRALLSLLLLSPFLISQAAPPAASPAEEPITAQQKADIAAARTPEQLLDLAKNYVLQRSFPAAGAAVQKAVQLKPELLADARPQSPRSWNEFWFTHRATLVEQKLPKNDAAGRVVLAQWLHDAGFLSQAAQTLTRALAIDKNHPEAQALANQWNLGSGGPIRFDFTYALSQPLFIPAIQEQGVEILIQRNNTFLIMPIAYDTTDTRLNITKATLAKATTDEGKPCANRGIALLRTDGTGGATATTDGSATLPKLQWPESSEPLWERVQVQQKADKSGYELACYNQSPPIPKPQPRAPGTPRERPAPAPRVPASPSGGPGGKETREATGYAAFLLEVPQTMKAITLELRGAAPLTIESGFLQALAVTSATATAERDAAINVLLAASQAAQGPIASAAVGKLAVLRFGASDSGQQSSALTNPVIVERIDRALLAAMSHPDGPTRQTTFDVALRRKEPPPEPLLQQIRTFPQPAALITMLEAIRQFLAQPKPPEEPGQPGTAPPPPVASGNDWLSSLPSSTAPPALFAATTACLAHADARVRQKAVELLLADGSRESVDALSKVAGPARETVAAGLGGIDNPALKAAVVRALLVKADPPTAVRLLEAAGPMTFAVTHEDDPLLAALNMPSSPKAIELLLGLLARADLTAVSGSEKLRQSLEQIAASQLKEAGVRAALLELALGQISRLPYEAPIKRERSSGPGSLRTGAAFEGLLASLAAASTDRKAAQTAAMALIRSGRINLLSERLTSASDPKRRKELVEMAVRERELGEREALPVFLARRLSPQPDPDPDVLQTAVSGLAIAQKRLDPKRRWRFNLGMKQGVENSQLMDLTAQSDEKVAQTAAEILISLAMFPTQDAAAFASADRSQRDQRLGELEQQRQSKPSGSYMAMIYVDLDRAAEAGQTPAATQPASLPSPGISIPLAALAATLQPAGGAARVLVDGNDITLSASAGPAGAAPGGMRINAAALLRTAFTSPEAAGAGLADSVDLSPLNEPRECDLKYERLGTWSCEVTLPDAGTPVEGRSLKLTSAKVVFEPLPPR